ncbi:metallophosphoesterase [Pseudocolwellia sp. HL-MZ19]|uniref:metallophosphoesterase n=1 Tax=unclassified Pseudocolwellia TaxID=2848178 RepID=UPI003CF9BA57
MTQSTDKFSIALAGDWDDHWGAPFSKGKKTLTRDSMREAGKSDLVVLIGDLSYGRNKLAPKEQALHWCKAAKVVSNNTPMIFVPGDHDSHNQHGDIATYRNCLTPTGNNTVASAPQTDGYGLYPYLYYVDVTVGKAKMRIVATSIAFQEEEYEPAHAQKYFTDYEKDKPNYQWLKSVYQEAIEQERWLIHFNHLPCIDMGKNQSFGQGCEDVINLNIEQGVNVFLSGSSHNIWRTHLLSHSEACPQVPLTTTANGANPACVIDRTSSTFTYGAGLVQAHAGAGGKLSASKRAIPCDPKSDGEAAHYLAPNSCGTHNVPGFVELSVSEQELTAKYKLIKSNTYFEPYGFKFVKPIK